MKLGPLEKCLSKLRNPGQLQKNVISGMVASAGGAMLMAFSYPFYLSKIGYHTYGIWIALTIIVSMSQVGNLGMSQALVRRVAECYEKREHNQIEKYYSTAVFTISAVALVLFVALWLLKALVTHLIGIPAAEARTYSQLITGVFALSVLTFIVDIASSVLSGLGRIDLYNYSQLVTQSVAVISTVVLLCSGFQLTGMLIAQLTGYCAGLFFSLRLVKIRLGFWPLRITSYSHEHLKRLLGEGSLLVGSWVMSLIFHPMNKVLLAQAGYFADLPIYEISVNLSMRLRNLFESGQRALMPETSRLISTRNAPGPAIASLVRTSIKGLLVGATPMYAFMLLFAGPLTKVWLRHSFSPAVPSTLRFFLVGTFISLLGTPLYYALIGMGKAGSVLLANAVQLITGLAGVSWVLRAGMAHQGSQVAQVLTMADVALAASTALLAVAILKGIRDLNGRQATEFARAAA
jgi:O-antigen/teichoic acid export membrane protein